MDKADERQTRRTPRAALVIGVAVASFPPLASTRVRYLAKRLKTRAASVPLPAVALAGEPPAPPRPERATEAADAGARP